MTVIFAVVPLSVAARYGCSVDRFTRPASSDGAMAIAMRARHVATRGSGTSSLTGKTLTAKEEEVERGEADRGVT